MTGLPDYITYHLKILFVGYNPGERSALVQHHYAFRGNQFWKLLFESGLTSRLYLPEEDSQILQEDYGLTNIVARPSKSSADLSPAELREGAEVLREKVKEYKPKIVCFLGKEIYRKFAGLKSSEPVNCGLVIGENTIADTLKFVAYSPSGRSTVPYHEKLEVLRLLNDISIKDS